MTAVSVSDYTTRENLYEDNANRCLLLYVDSRKEQDKAMCQTFLIKLVIK